MMVGSIFDVNQQNKTRLVNLFYYRDVITIAKLKPWASCGVRFITRPRPKCSSFFFFFFFLSTSGHKVAD